MKSGIGELHIMLSDISKAQISLDFPEISVLQVKFTFAKYS